MKPPRFTIGNLLVLVLVLAVGFAAWKRATPALEGAVFGSVLIVLLTSILLAVHRRGSNRAAWLGFALFGWSYLVLVQIPAVSARLPTTWGLAYLDSTRSKRVDALTTRMNSSKNYPWDYPVLESSIDGRPIGTPQAGIVRIWDPWTGRVLIGVAASSEAFLRVGHSLLALAMAFIGAFASRHLRDRERRREAPASVQETSTSSPTS